MNFFEKKTYNMKKADPTVISHTSVKRQKLHKPLFEFQGKYEDEERYNYGDENINQAIELRQDRQKHTDFYFQLHDLKERIEVYNKIFGTRTPKYMHFEYQQKKNEVKAKQREQRFIDIQNEEVQANTPAKGNNSTKHSSGYRRQTLSSSKSIEFSS